MHQSKPRLDLLIEFDAAPDWALFTQEYIAAVRDCSEATLERDRWSGGGIPFVRDGRSIRYIKGDVLKWLAAKKVCHSTTEADELRA
ncbi:MAG: DNA-binding protein [Gammaproteobacteria bacterium]